MSGSLTDVAGLGIVVHDMSRAVRKFYADAASVLRRTAEETERVDAHNRAPVRRHRAAPSRELPPLVEALRQVEAVPDVLVCDGFGVAHPRRFGLASHIGVLTVHRHP